MTRWIRRAAGSVSRLEEQRTSARSREVGRAHQAVVSASDDDRIVVVASHGLSRDSVSVG
jgi:hypothetical protein